MSKVGKVPIQVPATVQTKIDPDVISIKGREGELRFNVPKLLQLSQEGDKIVVKAIDAEKKTKSLHGLFRQLIFNAIKGVESPWRKKLEVVGTGFNVKLQGEDLLFKIGFSHPVIFKKKPSVRYQIEGNNKVIVLGVDKQLVGQVAFQIKMLKPPDVYKGKGIRYEGEIIKLKPGKKVKATATAA